MPEFARRSWAQIRDWMGGLTRAERVAMVSLTILGVIAVAALVWLVGSPEMVPISGFASSRSGEVMQRLRGSGIRAETDAGMVVVPKHRFDEAIIVLATMDMLGEDTSAAFDEYIANNQSPWLSDKQGDRNFLIAKQHVLAQVISSMKGVKTASVMIDVPEETGFGQTYHPPTASVFVQTSGSYDIDKKLVEAIAGLVSHGASAMMRPQDVVVVANGRQFTVKDEQDVLPGDSLEHLQQVERYHREKILNVLSHIPGVHVSVNVRTDPVQRHLQEEIAYQDSQPLTSEETETEASRDLEQSGEPGARPNTGLDIAGSGGAGREQTREFTRTEFSEPKIVKKDTRTIAGHVTQQINVTVAVPRAWFVGIWRGMNPDSDQAPNDEALAEVIAQQTSDIEEMVTPLVSTEGPGTVVAKMIPDETLMPITADALPTSGLTSLMDSQWSGPVGAGALALMVLAIMMYMVRKSIRPESLPSIEELAGVPPTLPTEEDLVGEVANEEASMIGVELGEEELRSRRIAEQISEMIKSNPAEASSLMGRWVRTEE